MGKSFDRLRACYENCRKKVSFRPKIALVLGSGLGDYGEKIQVETVLDYSEIEGFPTSTVSGHKGRFLFGYVAGVPMVAMQGRVHYYEGYSICLLYTSGVYKGIEKISVDKVEKDYIKIEYSGGDNLYILATQLDMIQKYAGADAKKPKLNKLGGQEWHRTKTRVRGAVKDLAEDLIKLYAIRQSQKGFAYGEDTIWQKEFEEAFPYEETEDQLTAIEAAKRDMESPRIMDRLICGDVGYGKTEVAIRAAFKAVSYTHLDVYKRQAGM